MTGSSWNHRTISQCRETIPAAVDAFEVEVADLPHLVLPPDVAGRPARLHLGVEVGEIGLAAEVDHRGGDGTEPRGGGALTDVVAVRHGADIVRLAIEREPGQH